MIKIADLNWKTLTTLALVTVATVATGIAQDNQKVIPDAANANADKDVSLEVAVMLGVPGPTFAFTMINNSKAALRAAGPDIDPCRIIIVKPNGETVEQFAAADMPPGKPFPVIQPSQTKTWKINMSDVFTTSTRLKEVGAYRIYWKYIKRKADGTINEYKSNDLILLKDKSVPNIDPYTGRPTS